MYQNNLWDPKKKKLINVLNFKFRNSWFLRKKKKKKKNMRELRPRIERAWQGDGAAMIIILPGDVTHRPFFFHGARVPRVSPE